MSYSDLMGPGCCCVKFNAIVAGISQCVDPGVQPNPHNASAIRGTLEVEFDGVVVYTSATRFYFEVAVTGDYTITLTTVDGQVLTRTVHLYSDRSNLPVYFTATYGRFPGCFCACNLPTTLQLISSNPVCSCAIWQTQTLTWGDPPVTPTNEAPFGKGWYSSEFEIFCGRTPYDPPWNAPNLYDPIEGPAYYRAVCKGSTIELSILFYFKGLKSWVVMGSIGAAGLGPGCPEDGAILPVLATALQYPAGNFPSPSGWCYPYSIYGVEFGDPDFHVELVIGGSAELSPQVAMMLPPGAAGLTAWATPRRGTVRVGLWCPCLLLGGAESHQETLIRTTDAARISWIGAAVTMGDSPGMIDPDARESLAALVPIRSGLEAARDLASRCDVILTWAGINADEVLEGLENPPKVLAINHLDETGGGW